MVKYAGELCRLRPLRREDIEKTLGWRNDPAVRDMTLGCRFPVTVAMEEAWFEDALSDMSNRRIIFAVEDGQHGELIGLVYLFDIDWVCGTAVFTIIIGETAFHGRGIGTEATALTLEIAFSHLNLRKLTLRVAEFNRGARRIYDKLGFKQEGRLKDHVFYDGAYHDVLVLSIFRPRPEA